MNFNLRKEFPVILIVLLPFFYLAYIWNELPEKVPLHWNANGEIDRWGGKLELLLIPFLLPLLIYIIFIAVPLVDPKGKIKQMGNKYHHLKFILVLFMSVLAVFILHASQTQSTTSMSIVFSFLGVLFLILGNYFKTLRPNYFIGIRTPWTLENEEVWKSTHLLAGKLWFIGGFLIIIFGLLLSGRLLTIVFLLSVALLAAIPIVHSYIKFKSLKNSL